MNAILSLLFAAIGFLVIGYRRKLSHLMYEKNQVPIIKLISEFGFRSIDSKTSKNYFLHINRWGLIFAGVVLILMGFAMLLGPINL